jgi:hypothetical protein
MSFVASNFISDLIKAPDKASAKVLLDVGVESPTKTTVIGNGVLTTFAISGSASLTNPNALVVAIDGVMQEPGVDYTVSGSNITFTDPLPSGAKAVIVINSSVSQITEGVPSDGSVTSSKLAPNLTLVNPTFTQSLSTAASNRSNLNVYSRAEAISQDERRGRLARTVQKLRINNTFSSAPSSYPWLTPLRILPLGDSLITLTGSLGFERLGAVGGFWDTTSSAILTGGATFLSNQMTESPNGHIYNMPNGSTATVRVDGGGLTGTTADTVAIAYQCFDGAGSFIIAYSRDNGSTWTDLETVNCQNPAKIGAYIERSIPYSNRTQVRLTSVGTTRVLAIGAFMRGIGGAITLNLFTRGGLNADQYQCPDAIAQPIIAGFAPDIIPILWHDDPVIYGNGMLDNIVNRMLASPGLTRPDLLIIAKNPAQDISVSDAHNILIPAIRSWASRYNAEYYDGYSIFGDLASAQSQGLINAGADVHPTALGYVFRNNCIQRDLFMEGDQAISKLSYYQVRPDTLSGQKTVVIDPAPNQLFDVNLGVRFRCGLLADGAISARVPNELGGWNSRGGFYMDATDVAFFNFSGGAFRPAANNTLWGTSSFRWNVYTAGHSTATGVINANYAPSQLDHTLAVDANSGNITITLPNWTLSNMQGRVFVISKIDASSNTVTVLPTTGQSLNGSGSGIVLSSRWQTITVQLINSTVGWVVTSRS